MVPISNITTVNNRIMTLEPFIQNGGGDGPTKPSNRSRLWVGYGAKSSVYTSYTGYDGR